MDNTPIHNIGSDKFWSQRDYIQCSFEESPNQSKSTFFPVSKMKELIASPVKSPRKQKMDEELWNCSICQKSFSSKSNLQIHSTIHSGQRYICQSCNKGFTQKCNLRRHEATHLGHKSFICVMCKKTFTQKVNLQRHYAMHSGLKEFCCDACGKGFGQKANLEKHLKNHVGISNKLKMVVVKHEGTISQHSDSYD